MKAIGRIRVYFTLALALLLFLGLAGGLGPSSTPAPRQADQQVELLVKFIPEADPSDIARLHQQNHAQPVNTLPEIGVHVVKVPAASAAGTLASYNNHPLVKFAELNPTVQVLDFPQDPPDDPHFELQWGTKRIKAPEAWAVTTSSPDVRIAILDTGIDLDHPDLSAKIMASQNFSSSSTVEDISGHGTHVAGIAAAITNNATGVAGVGCHASLLNVKVLGDDGGGTGFSISQGILWATNGPDGDPNTDDGAHVINLSLGSLVPSPTVEEAINYAWEHGVVLTAAAGNHGSTSPGYPARYPNVIAVAGSRTYPDDPLMPSSAHGDWVDVAAPGESIWSTWNNGGYGNGAGTSMASPFVAGLAALLYTSPNISDLNGNGFINDEIKYAIEASCKDTGVDVKYGRVNAYDAVTASIPSLGFVSGTVVDDSTGDPVYPTYGCSIKAGTREAFTYPDGSYTIYGVPAGDYELTVSALGWEEASQLITVTPGGTTTVDFRLTTSPPGAISGFVRDIYYSPIEGATVTDGTRQTTSAADGSYTLTDVPSGNYTVTASAPGYMPTSSGVIVLSGQTATQNFMLPASRLDSNSAPHRPSTPSPEDGATAVATDSDLGWKGGDPDGDAVTYDVYFGTSVNPRLVSEGQAETRYDPGMLQYDTQYSWKVVARDSSGATTEGPLWSFTTEASPPPQADFWATPVNGGEPLVIAFTDTSTSYDGITSRTWDFGDGTTSTDQNPVHTYAQDGVYSVCLTVTEADGDSDTATRTDYIVVLDSGPQVDFSISPVGESTLLTVSFTDLSASYDGIACWLWEFGDGTTSNVRNPKHTYAEEGLYNVTLTVTEADGSVGAVTRQARVATPGIDVTVLAGGEPVQNHRVYAYTSDGAYAASKLTDASGQASFTLSPGDYSFRVYYGGSYWWSQTVTSPGNTTIDIPAPTTVVVTVDGNPLASCWIYAYAAEGDYVKSQTADAAGEASFTLPPGDYKFRVYYGGSYWWSQTVTSPGSATIDIPAPTAVTVTVGSDPLGYCWVYAYTVDGAYAGGRRADASGQASFTLAEGDYRFRVYYNGSYWWSQVVSTPCSTAVCAG